MVEPSTGEFAVRSIKLTLSEPVFAMTAKPVAGFIATSLGDEPAGSGTVAIVVIAEAGAPLLGL
jgi:hypothetical protein